MSFAIIISDELKQTLTTLKRKDHGLFQMVEKKIVQIASSDDVSIQHYKNLQSPLNDYKRVHVGSFVLLF
jgi:mRNA-degrading endonuclease RelE of RelBE toxin-antitoxin system